jgi:hypothetical protein
MFDKLFRKKPQKPVPEVPLEVTSPGGFKRPLHAIIAKSKNSWLPPMLDSSEMGIRTEDELYQRMIALWAVVGMSSTNENYFRDYIVENGMTEWLTEREKRYLFSDDRSKRDETQFSWQHECICLLAWCGGLFDDLGIPKGQTTLGDWFDLFPHDMEDVGRLRLELKIRDKQELMYWSDDLMNAHWAVRNAYLNKRPGPAGIDGEVIQEWHYAINWMVYFLEDPQDWDDVTTDT